MCTRVVCVCVDSFRSEFKLVGVWTHNIAGEGHLGTADPFISQQLCSRLSQVDDKSVLMCLFYSSSTVLYCAVLCCAVLHYTVLYCAVLVTPANVQFPSMFMDTLHSSLHVRALHGNQPHWLGPNQIPGNTDEEVCC